MNVSNGVDLQASVVVCAHTFDRWYSLVAAIGSLRCQETPAGEVILVIDHNPELYEKAQVEFPDLHIVENQKPRGLSGGRNTGIEHARYGVVVFMDEDATAEPDWLTWLMNGYQNERVIGVGGMAQPNWLGKRPEWFPDEFAWVVGCTYKGLPETVGPVRNMIGCNMSFRREVFEYAGGFRDSLGRQRGMPLVSCDETELCIRVRQKFPEGQILHEPRARVYHEVPAKRGTWEYFRERCYAEGFSKAMVATYVGAQDGLSSERSHTLRVLPRGILNGIQDSFSEGNLNGLLRANAIVAGLAITSFGYLIGRFKIHPEKPQAVRLRVS